MSSTELLNIMRNRNMLVSSVSRGNTEEDDLFRPDDEAGSRSQIEPTSAVEQSHMDLLADVRNFVAFQVSKCSESLAIELNI